jgi:hypothetical protein
MKREPWGRGEWVGTLFLCLVFPPLGFAALARWMWGKRVWL